MKPSLVDMLDELQAGRCPTCHVERTGERAVGNDVVAEPCGHPLLRAPVERDRRPAPPRPISSGAAAQDRWERDHDDVDEGRRS